MGGKRQKRLDFVCQCLMKAKKDAKMDKERSDALGHRNKRTAKVRKTHKLAKYLAAKGKLQVTRQDSDKNIRQYIVMYKDLYYVVTQINENACHDCPFQCKICRTCLHQFYCSCRDFRVRMRPCFHLHGIALDKKVLFDFYKSEGVHKNNYDEPNEEKSDSTEEASEIENLNDVPCIGNDTPEIEDPIAKLQNEVQLQIESIFQYFSQSYASKL
jgi:hypothetical protein